MIKQDEMIVATPSFHFDGNNIFNKLKKTAAANCSLFFKCILMHFVLCCSVFCTNCTLCFQYIMDHATPARCVVLCAICALSCSCNSELDELGIGCSRQARTLWADEHLREPERKPERVRVSQNEWQWQWQSEPEREPEWVSCREKLNYGTFCHKYAVYALCEPKKWQICEASRPRSLSSLVFFCALLIAHCSTRVLCTLYM